MTWKSNLKALWPEVIFPMREIWGPDHRDWKSCVKEVRRLFRDKDTEEVYVRFPGRRPIILTRKFLKYLKVK